MSNFVKNHETSVTNANHKESVNAILSNVENTPYALRGATVKTILYFLFSVIAAIELSAALFFYVASLGVSKAVAMVVCGAVAFAFHGLLHSILTDTAKGIVFGKRKESGAMSNEVTANIILSIVLLLMASCTVFFVGKKGFTAYRATQYEVAQSEQVKPKNDGVTAQMLTGKSGKIAAYKLEMLADLEKAKSKTVDSETAKTANEASRYDATTATITDIVGASAFVLEVLLLLLAYTIATAKKAASIEEIARRKEQAASPQTATEKGTFEDKTSVTASVTDAVTPSRKIGFSDNRATNNTNGERVIIKGFQSKNDEKGSVTASVTDAVTDAVDKIDMSKLKMCLYCEKEYVYRIHNQKYCSETCRIDAWEEKNGKKLRRGVNA